MAISVNWITGVIFVPKSDCTLVQLTPYEIRDLDLNWFRLQLRDLEDNPDGRPWPRTHDHNTTVTVSGIELARVITILDPYTVTFEDGQWAVNLLGANSNVGDKVNANQVSVRSANSAGLVQTKELQYAAFNGGVWVDPNSTNIGTIYNSGTPLKPVNNMTDALLINAQYGFNKFYIMSDFTLGGGLDLDDMIFVGASEIKTTITIDPSVSIVDATFYDATVQGTLDGNARIQHCTIRDLTFVAGRIEKCVIEGTITLGGSLEATILDCWSGVGGHSTPTINCGGAGQSLALRNYNGGITITNKTGSDTLNVGLDAGQVILDDTCGGTGSIILRGEGKWTNEHTYAGGADAYISNELLVGKHLQDVNAAHMNRRTRNVVTGEEIIYEYDKTTPRHLFDSTDDGSQITEITPQ